MQPQGRLFLYEMILLHGLPRVPQLLLRLPVGLAESRRPCCCRAAARAADQRQVGEAHGYVRELVLAAQPDLRGLTLSRLRGERSHKGVLGRFKSTNVTG